MSGFVLVLFGVCCCCFGVLVWFLGLLLFGFCFGFGILGGGSLLLLLLLFWACFVFGNTGPGNGAYVLKLAQQAHNQ